MTRKPYESGELDRSAYEAADHHFRLVQDALPVEAVEDLAREVVRRLAFRLPRHLGPDHRPSPEEIDRLCAALLSRDEMAGDRIIFAARREGVPTEVIYLSYVAEAARQLGRMWEEDKASFAEVTLGTGRLYRIIRGLRFVIDGALSPQAEDRHVLFALVPDESHTLGIEITTDLFRRAGWDVDLSLGETHEDIVTRTENARFRAILLVANSQTLLANLISLVLALRITQPLAHVVVGGKILEQVDDVQAVVGADATLPDLETAVDTLRDIINPRGAG